MTNTGLYDWGLEDPDPPVQFRQGLARLANPAARPSLDVLIQAQRRAAQAEFDARTRLRDALREDNLLSPPQVGDKVVPWSLLRETTNTTYPIVHISGPAEDPQVLVYLGTEGAHAYALYGIGDFLVRYRAQLGGGE